MKRKNILYNPYFLTGIILFIVAFITWQQLNQGGTTFEPGGQVYSRFNNYAIFRQSFFHLIRSQDLYIAYPAEHWDLYKYSPTFSLLMCPMALLPDIAGLFLWNLLNTLVLFFALWKLNLPKAKRLWMLGFILIELITSVQNA